MTSGPMSDREIARRQALTARQALSPEVCSQLSRRIAGRLVEREEYRGARIVMAYASFRGEVETGDIILRALADGKTVALPITHRGSRSLEPKRIADPGLLVSGAYGIPEPPPEAETIDSDQIDLCLLPGVAFDSYGGRLGYGAGYYDRFLERMRPEAHRLALAFEVQIVSRIPPRVGDQPMDVVITELRTIDTGARWGGTR